MTRPSIAEMVAMSEEAKKLLDKKHPEQATLDEVAALHKRLNLAVDSFADAPVFRTLYILKCSKQALQYRKQLLQRAQTATAS